MNMEVGIDRDGSETLEALDQRRRRRWIVIGGVALAVAAVLAYLVFGRGGPPPVPSAPPPRVTVVVPGRQLVAASISAPGNIGARRDMPVGIAGEGGVVHQVLVEPGTWVKAGQTLAVVDRSVQTQQAAAIAGQIAQARADAALAQANLERARKLVGNGFISRADLDAREATLANANARIRTTTAQLRQQQALIGRLDVRAPAGGLVLTRTVEAGQIVGPASGALFRVAENGAMEMQARLAEIDLARLRVGAPATVTPVGTDVKIAGRIWQISPVIDPASRQGTVRIALPYNEALRPGGFANATIGGGSGDVPLLPESAVMSDGKGSFVYVVGADDKVARRDVVVGDVDDRGVTVRQGLTGRERVVASAGAFLNPGDKVTPSLQAR